MNKDNELELLDYVISELTDIVDNAGYGHDDDVAWRKHLLNIATNKKKELESNCQIINVPMRNGHNIVVDINHWSDENPEEVCVYFEHNNTILQDIAIIREHKKRDAVEVMVYADDYNEDYTHKFEIKEHNFEEDK